MKVQVFAQTYLESYIKSGGDVYSHLISIGNPKSRFRRQEDCNLPAVFKKSFKSILRFSFYDVLEKHHLGPNQKIKRIPRKSDVKRMIRYYHKTKNTATGYTFHCWAGVSRSGAMALGVLYLIYKDENKAAEELVKVRPIVRPHQKIVKWFDDELGCNLSEVNEKIRVECLERTKREIDSYDLEEL